MIKYLVTLALAAALFGSAAAQATTTVINAVLDGHTLPSANNPNYHTPYLMRFAFNPGDTLDVTLTFPGSAPLNLGFLPASVRFLVSDGSGPTGTVYQSTATLQFINAIGDVYPSTGPQTGVFDRNPAVVFTDVRRHQRGPLTFDGVHVLIQLDSAVLPYGPPGPLPPQTFGAFSLSFINDVPEPAAWAMLITGFALTGTMARRLRRLA